MILRDAVTKVDAVLRNADLMPSEIEAIAALRDHARATSGLRDPAPEGRDLAKIAEQVGQVCSVVDDEMPGTWRFMQAGRLRAIATELRRLERCAPAPSVATPPQEGEGEGAGAGAHRMVPGSHERPGGPECTCGRPWSRADDACGALQDAAPAVEVEQRGAEHTPAVWVRTDGSLVIRDLAENYGRDVQWIGELQAAPADATPLVMDVDRTPVVTEAIQTVLSTIVDARRVCWGDLRFTLEDGQGEEFTVEEIAGKIAAALGTVATAPDLEIVMGDEAQALPVGSAILDERDVELGVGPYANVRTGPRLLDWSLRCPGLARRYRVLHRGPVVEPTVPLALGESVDSSIDAWSRGPVGAALRGANGMVGQINDGSVSHIGVITGFWPARVIAFPDSGTTGDGGRS